MLSNSLVTKTDNQIVKSLDYYEIIASRDPLFSQMIAYYRENIARNFTLMMTPDSLDRSGNMTEVSAVDYFLD